MKKFTICVIGLGFALACFAQTATAQSFTVKGSRHAKMKVVNPVGQEKSWNQVTQEVRRPYQGHHGYNAPHPSHGHHHYAPPRPPRHHHYGHPHFVPAPRVYVPAYPVYPHHGYHHHRHHSGFSLQIGGPHGGIYFSN